MPSLRRTAGSAPRQSDGDPLGDAGAARRRDAPPPDPRSRANRRDRQVRSRLRRGEAGDPRHRARAPAGRPVLGGRGRARRAGDRTGPRHRSAAPRRSQATDSRRARLSRGFLRRTRLAPPRPRRGGPARRALGDGVPRRLGGGVRRAAPGAPRSAAASRRGRGEAHSARRVLSVQGRPADGPSEGRPRSLGRRGGGDLRGLRGALRATAFSGVAFLDRREASSGVRNGRRDPGA